MRYQEFNKPATCSECGGPSFSNLILAEKQDACYHKVKSRYKVWPSAYASGALVQCRKKGAANWGNKSKNESVAEAGANTKSFRSGYSKRKETKPLSPEEQIAKDKAQADKWLEKERAKMAAKKGVTEGK